MKDNKKQFAEDMIVSTVMSFVSKYPQVNSLELCIERYRELKNKELYGSLKTEKIKLENLLRAIRRYSKNYATVTKDEVFSLFNEGLLKAEKLKVEEERRQENKIMEIPIEMMREIEKKYPDISLERVIELLNIGFSKAQEEMIKELHEEEKE